MIAAAGVGSGIGNDSRELFEEDSPAAGPNLDQRSRPWDLYLEAATWADAVDQEATEIGSERSPIQRPYHDVSPLSE